MQTVYHQTVYYRVVFHNSQRGTYDCLGFFFSFFLGIDSFLSIFLPVLSFFLSLCFRYVITFNIRCWFDNQSLGPLKLDVYRVAPRGKHKCWRAVSKNLLPTSRAGWPSKNSQNFLNFSLSPKFY